MAVEYSLAVAGISTFAFAVDMGLMEGIMVSAMASKVFHWAAVNGSSDGSGESGVAFGDTG